MPATENPVLSHPRLFQGWLVVAGAFAVTFVGFGSAYTFSAFVGSLQQEFGASRGSVSVPAVGAVQRWFVRRRGLASGLAVSGIGVGTLVMPPLASFLIDRLGWRTAYLVLGGLAVVVGVGMAMMIANDPRDRGLEP